MKPHKGFEAINKLCTQTVQIQGFQIYPPDDLFLQFLQIY